LKVLKERLALKRHAVIVAAEGAGQDLLENSNERDASGNVRFGDIGLFLKEKIQAYLKEIGMDHSLKYIDPSYTIRSMPANPHDSVFCLLLGHNAAHAGMAGRTNMLVSFWKDQFTHVPVSLAVSRRKQIDPKGRLWSQVLASTGQPAQMI
jgi:6-phosphofructokinase 1